MRTAFLPLSSPTEFGQTAVDKLSIRVRGPYYFWKPCTAPVKKHHAERYLPAKHSECREEVVICEQRGQVWSSNMTGLLINCSSDKKKGVLYQCLKKDEGDLLKKRGRRIPNLQLFDFLRILSDRHLIIIIFVTIVLKIFHVVPPVRFAYMQGFSDSCASWLATFSFLVWLSFYLLVTIINSVWWLCHPGPLCVDTFLSFPVSLFVIKKRRIPLVKLQITNRNTIQSWRPACAFVQTGWQQHKLCSEPRMNMRLWDQLQCTRHDYNECAFGHYPTDFLRWIITILAWIDLLLDFFDEVLERFAPLFVKTNLRGKPCPWLFPSS